MKLIRFWYKLKLGLALVERDRLRKDINKCGRFDYMDNKVQRLRGKVAYWTARIEL